MCGRKAVVSSDRFDSKFDSLSVPKISAKVPVRLTLAKNGLRKRFLKGCVSKRITPAALSSMATNSDFSIEEDYSSSEFQSSEPDANRVNHLVRILHESARSFSAATRMHELARTGSPLAMAWNVLDVNAWHKRIAYPVILMRFFFINVEF